MSDRYAIHRIWYPAHGRISARRKEAGIWDMPETPSPADQPPVVVEEIYPKGVSATAPVDTIADFSASSLNAGPVVEPPARDGSVRSFALGALVVLLGLSATSLIPATPTADRFQGKVISTSRVQTIQSGTAGVLDRFDVSPGDHVTAGQVIARLHRAGISPDLDGLTVSIAALEIRRLRLKAELSGLSDFIVPSELLSLAPDVVAQERRLLAARQTDQSSRLEGARRAMDEARRERDLAERLVERQLLSEGDVGAATGAFTTAQQRYDRIMAQIVTEREVALLTVQEELTKLKEALEAAQRPPAPGIVKTPIPGVVKRVADLHPGAKISHGDILAEIEPPEQDLSVELVLERDQLAELSPGQVLSVAISGQPDLPAETLTVQIPAHRPAETATGQYVLSLPLDRKQLQTLPDTVGLRPGLQAFVELNQPETTMLNRLTGWTKQDR